jgi:hypothetical protein
MKIAYALDALRPNSKWILRGDEYSGIEWLDEAQTKPTEQEINDEIAKQDAQRPFDECKAKAKQLIAATDWSVLPDVGLKNSADFVTYRGILRGLIITPVADPVWPTEPTPVWE